MKGSGQEEVGISRGNSIQVRETFCDREKENVKGKKRSGNGEC